MYHVSSDKRVQRSATLITQGFHDCLLKKNYQDITVSDILKASTVGRATFYRLFDSTRDILEYECDLMFAQINSRSSTDKSAKENLLLDIVTFMQHDILLEALVKSQQTSIISDAEQRHIEHNALFQNIESISGYERDFYMSTLTYLLVSTLSTWIKHDKKEDAIELFSALQTAIHMVDKTIENIANQK
ncbi:MAG TPA: hypothetical protein DCW31_05525 [Lactobacillus sp.]|nr:hypothetical protein [Lactobacillus sp.]